MDLGDWIKRRLRRGVQDQGRQAQNTLEEIRIPPSSFYLEPVYRLVPVFNPFLMAVLLVRVLNWTYTPADLVGQIFKIVVPYVILSAAFATLNACLGLPPFSLFLVALTLTDGNLSSSP
ncbi:hypothetical protein JVT61DRAFT_14528 [Boletus reticuloceps]|uniref:GPI ethanolamine phosphate transferase 1 C-terminal domain-containing protein n=1 Tax=Boletus reticuloceps TaxID=495285 RepID=A0A8I2YSL9_9AGAM|nr:hypothetical protein JVT61DRAFT_14528 [Boletus reticuloceps]